MFAVLQPVVGGLYLSGLREQKRGTAHSQPWPEQDHSQPRLAQNREGVGWAAAHTVSALHGVVAPDLFPSASPTGCHIACPYWPQIPTTELES